MAIKTMHSVKTGLNFVLEDLSSQYVEISKVINPKMVLFFFNFKLRLSET